MKAIAAVIVLVGAFNVHFKMQNGDRDVKKTIMPTIGGLLSRSSHCQRLCQPLLHATARQGNKE